MSTATTRFRPAPMNAFERLSSPTECQRCGRVELRRTVKVTDGDAVLWLGTGCAAKAMGVGLTEYHREAKAVQDAADAAERHARSVADRAQDAAWQAFLDRAAPPWRIESDFGGRMAGRFEQIKALGGMTAARAMFDAEREAAEFLAAHATDYASLCDAE